MDNLISLIKTFFSKKYNTGANIDTRPIEEKKKIFYHEEIATGVEYSKYGKKEDVKKYPPMDQGSTSSCVANAVALTLGIDNELEGNGYVSLSPAFIYRQRSNYAAEGMILDDAFEIARKLGSCPIQLLNTPKTEYEINQVKISQAMKDEAYPFRAHNHVNIQNYNDMEVLNSIASQGKGLVVFIYATKREWAQEYPKVMDNIYLTGAPIRHGVTVLPKSGFIDKLGRKYIVVQDSVPEWGSYHCLDADFIFKRAYAAGYPLNLENAPATTEKPYHIFTIPMGNGDINEEVKWLQKCLQYLGYFPTNTTPTGAFYGITLKAVKEFQNAYKAEILTPVGLEVATGYVGHATIKKLNALFNQ